jgi:DNA-binding beta-propeller fold protein YncE
MSLRRVGRLAAMALASVLWISCGPVYRPVVIPINTIPPNPANFHAVFSVNTNVPFNQGTAMQIDVSGDSLIGAADMGVNPTHGVSLPNNSRVFVAAAGSLFQGEADVVTAFTPAVDARLATGLGNTTVFTYPSTANGQSSNIVSLTESATGNVVTVTLSSPISTAKIGAEILISATSNAGYDGTYVISSVSGTTLTYTASISGLAPISTPGGIATVPVVCPYLPDFLATSQNNAVYVANYGVEHGLNCNLAATDSVALLSPSLNSITNIGYLPAGSHPVGMAETANGQNLYVMNQGSGTVAPNVTDISPVDLTPYCPSSVAPCPISVGANPVWITARPDGQRVYVVSQGTGELYTINTQTNLLVPGSPQSLGGPGANFVVYDPSLSRLYATNPTANAVFIFDATTDPPTPIGSPLGLSITAPPIPPNTPPCTGGACSYSTVMPVGVTALIDGSRFYVASYVVSNSLCPDPNVSGTQCVIPQVTVFDAGTLAVKTTVFPLLAPTVDTSIVDGVQPFAVGSVAYCVPAVPYSPAFTRFRMFAAASVDGSHVYASMCDGGQVADIFTTTDTISVGSNATDVLITDLLAPFSAGAPVNGEQPPQYPNFLFVGQ